MDGQPETMITGGCGELTMASASGLESPRSNSGRRSSCRCIFVYYYLLVVSAKIMEYERSHLRRTWGDRNL